MKSKRDNVWNNSEDIRLVSAAKKNAAIGVASPIWESGVEKHWAKKKPVQMRCASKLRQSDKSNNRERWEHNKK